MIPKILKNFNLYFGDDDPRYAGKCSITLPTLTIKREDYRAGGMDAPVAIDMGMDAIDIDFVLKEYEKTALSFFGVAAINEKMPKLTAKGAMQGDDGGVLPVVITATGTLVETNLGAWEAGTITENSFKLNCHTFFMEIDGEPIYEIDFVNMIRKIGGEDQLEAIRDAIGL